MSNDVFEIDGVFEIGGVVRMVRNLDRRWWQFWKPKMVPTKRLAQFRILSVEQHKA